MDARVAYMGAHVSLVAKRAEGEVGEGGQESDGGVRDCEGNVGRKRGFRLASTLSPFLIFRFQVPFPIWI